MHGYKTYCLALPRHKVTFYFVQVYNDTLIPVHKLRTCQDKSHGNNGNFRTSSGHGTTHVVLHAVLATPARSTCIATQRLLPETATLPRLSHCADQCGCLYEFGHVRQSFVCTITCGEWVKLEGKLLLVISAQEFSLLIYLLTYSMEQSPS